MTKIYSLNYDILISIPFHWRFPE